MTDENGTVEFRPDAPSADDALFGDTVENADVTDHVQAEEQDGGGDVERDTQGAADTEDKPDIEVETDEAEGLRVVVSIKAGRAVIGVKKPSSDPHIETFDDHDLPALAQEVVAVTERAKAKWEQTPKHPDYERPAPPARRQSRRQQGTAQEGSAETTQQALNLF